MKKNPHIGSSLDGFLKEEGILEEARAAALKKTLAWQVQKAMKKAKITKVEMARRMNTSRAALDRLLDPDNTAVTLQTLCRAARAIGPTLLWVKAIRKAGLVVYRCCACGVEVKEGRSIGQTTGCRPSRIRGWGMGGLASL